MRRLFSVLILIYLSLSQNYDLNHFFISGKNASTAKGSENGESLYNILNNSKVNKKIHIRVFDASSGSKFDEGSFNSFFALRTNNGFVIDSIMLERDIRYDSQWRSLFSTEIKANEKIQFYVKSIDGNGINYYRLFISSSDIENIIPDGISVSSKKLNLRLSKQNNISYLLKFKIPSNANSLQIKTFDSDAGQTSRFQTFERPNIILKKGANALERTNTINVLNEEKASIANIVIEDCKSAFDNMQLSVWSNNKDAIPLTLPFDKLKRNKAPLAKIKSINLDDCYSYHLDAGLSQDPDGDLLSYEWLINDVFVSKEKSHLYRFLKPGKHKITLKVTDSSPFYDNFQVSNKFITINRPPTAIINAPEISVPGENVLFDASESYDEDGTIKSFYWDFGNDLRKEGKRVYHRFTSPGRYIVKLTVKDNFNGTCNTSTISRQIWINAKPIPLFTSPQIVAVNENIIFDASSSVDSDGKLKYFNWNFGNNDKSSAKRTNYSFQQAGTYKVTLTIGDDADAVNSRQSLSRTIKVNAMPIANFTYPSIVAENQVTTFNAAMSKDRDGKVIKYDWVIDGHRYEGRLIKHSFKRFGAYDIKLRVTDNSGVANNSNEINQTIIVNEAPYPEFNGNRVINKSLVSLDASGSRDRDGEIIKYRWQLSDGTYYTGKTISHRFRSTGEYSIKLTVTDNSGTKSAKQSIEKWIRVNHPPIADAGPKQKVSVSENVLFDAKASQDPDGDITLYKWTINNQSFTGKKINYQFKKAGIYQVKLEVKDNDNAANIHFSEIYVNAAPKAFFTHKKRIAPNEKVTFRSESFDNDGKITNIRWDFGDKSKIKAGREVIHRYKKPGFYKIKLIIHDDASVANSTQDYSSIIEVNHQPKAVFDDKVFSNEQSIHFNAKNSYDPDKDQLSYFWDFGDGTKAKGIFVKHFYKKGGKYPVILTVDDNQGLSNSRHSKKINLVINRLPNPSFNIAKQYCLGENILFDAAKSSDPDKDLLKYHWDFGDNTSAEGISTFHRFKKAGHYKVKLTVTDNSANKFRSSSIIKHLRIIDAPLAIAGDDQEVCANTTIEFDASASRGGSENIKSYVWDFGDGKKAAGIKVKHSYNKAGKYKVTLKVETAGNSNSCQTVSTDELTVNVIPAPKAIFNLASEACSHKEILLDASESSGGNYPVTEYYWFINDSLISQAKKLKYKFQQNGNYIVKLRIKADTDKSCNSAELSQRIKVNAKPNAIFTVSKINGNKKARFLTHQNILLSAEKSYDPDGSIKSFSWFIGEKKVSDQSDFIHSFKSAGEKQIKLIIGDGSKGHCKQDSSLLTINILDPRKDEVIPDRKSFTSEPVQFNYNNKTNEQGQIQWFFSDSYKATGNTIERTFREAGEYQYSINTDQNFATGTITIFEKPNITLPAEINLNSGDILFLSVPGKNPSSYEFTWHLNKKLISKKSWIKVKDLSPGQHEINFICSVNGLELERNIKVFKSSDKNFEIIIDAEKLVVAAARNEVRFKASNKSLNYKWIFSDKKEFIGQELIRRFLKKGKYRVIVYAWENGESISNAVKQEKEFLVKSY